MLLLIECLIGIALFTLIVGPMDHSGNIYQIFAYVKNEDVSMTGKVAGMLLYAKTEEEIVPDGHEIFGGNPISFRTLDLNRDEQ